MNSNDNRRSEIRVNLCAGGAPLSVSVVPDDGCIFGKSDKAPTRHPLLRGA